MKVLSVRQPWAWAIVEGFKDVENRTWTTKHRGPLLIHAAQENAENFDDARRKIAYREHKKLSDCDDVTIKPVPKDAPLPGFTFETEFHRGGIIGSVSLSEVIPSESRLACESKLGPYYQEGSNAWVFSGAERVDFIECRGWPGLFDYEIDEGGGLFDVERKGT